MHINVRSILAEDLGFSRSFSITGETPVLDQIMLTEPIEGSFTISRLDDGIVVEGLATSALQLECHRCLCTFSRPTHIRFSRVFTREPGDDELLIDSHDEIDLGELLQQEFIVDLPIKILHSPDCKGIIETNARDDSNLNVGQTARITKGS